MRLFVAVDLPDEARQAIAVRQKLLAGPLSKSKDGLKLVEPSRMHLTLLFIGEARDDARAGDRRVDERTCQHGRRST